MILSLLQRFWRACVLSVGVSLLVVQFAMLANAQGTWVDGGCGAFGPCPNTGGVCNSPTACLKGAAATCKCMQARSCPCCH